MLVCIALVEVTVDFGASERRDAGWQGLYWVSKSRCLVPLLCFIPAYSCLPFVQLDA